MEAGMVLSASLEDYLEAIYHIIREKQAAKARDIAARLRVKASSVTGALHQLAERKLINYAPYDLITLTPEGTTIAGDVVQRHTVLRDFFVKVLSVDEDAAQEAACKMEHAVTKDILERFTRFIAFVETCPKAGTKWINGFGYQCNQPPDVESCLRCIDESKTNLINKGDINMSDALNLRDVRPGTRVKITKLALTGLTARRFAEMGISEGTIVTVERVAPLGDPVEITVRGSKLSLRKEDLEKIEVINA